MNLKTFCIKANINYSEIKADGGLFNKFYEIVNPNQCEIVAIPDGCIDIQFVWRQNKCEAYVCGSFLKGDISQASTCERCFGVKFEPGVIPDFLKKDMMDIIGRRYRLDSYIKIEGILDQLRQDAPLSVKRDVFLSGFHPTYVQSHVITKYVISAVRKSDGYLNVSELIDTLGYSHRYSDRIFKSCLGMSIKKYADIIRLQQAIEMIRTGEDDNVYSRLGYYDQAHFIHKFKRFTSFTPMTYQRESKNISIV